MKKLVAANTVLTTRRNLGFTVTGIHDAWGTHGTVADALGIELGASGTAYLYLFAILHDGSEVFYIHHSEPDMAAMTLYLTTIQSWKSPDGLAGFIGLYYNFIVRLDCIFKGSAAEFYDWLASH